MPDRIRNICIAANSTMSWSPRMSCGSVLKCIIDHCCTAAVTISGLSLRKESSRCRNALAVTLHHRKRHITQTLVPRQVWSSCQRRGPYFHGLSHLLLLQHLSTKRAPREGDVDGAPVGDRCGTGQRGAVVEHHPIHRELHVFGKRVGRGPEHHVECVCLEMNRGVAPPPMCTACCSPHSLSFRNTSIPSPDILRLACVSGGAVCGEDKRSQ